MVLAVVQDVTGDSGALEPAQFEQSLGVVGRELCSVENLSRSEDAAILSQPQPVQNVARVEAGSGEGTGSDPDT